MSYFDRNGRILRHNDIILLSPNSILGLTGINSPIAHVSIVFENSVTCCFNNLGSDILYRVGDGIKIFEFTILCNLANLTPEQSSNFNKYYEELCSNIGIRPQWRLKPPDKPGFWIRESYGVRTTYYLEDTQTTRFPPNGYWIGPLSISKLNETYDE